MSTPLEKMASGPDSEKFQLKWHSYGAHLHSSVATLLHSESFTDVLLSTSDGRHVAAHRFVLATCSAYLGHIFQTCHLGTNTNAPIVIVLPTEISYRTIKILIQYMYSGETTVSNDQLEGVLRAGDILRVRGLYRNDGSNRKENLQSNIQKFSNEKDKRDLHAASGNIQKIKLIQPVSERLGDCCGETTAHSVRQQSPVPKNHISTNTHETKKDELEIIDKTNKNSEIRESIEETSSNEQTKNKENVEMNNKKRFSIEVEAIQSKSDTAENGRLDVDLLVKEEPMNWEDSPDASDSLTIDHDLDIKPEIVHSADEDAETEEEYTPLTCDMCRKTFPRPSDWVRHIEFAHSDMADNKKRKRRADSEDDSNDFPPLKCDLCGNAYPTPQEWVRHIQTEHTEEQLAFMNNSTPPKPKRVHSHQKLCNICQKVFPSHASMVIHQRTHTGEKPFLCSYCNKGFNVKSNLLRHLRTLHDKCVPPSLYAGNTNKHS